MNPEERRTIGVTTASHGLVHLYENVMPPLFPLLMVFFNTDYFHLGFVFMMAVSSGLILVLSAVLQAFLYFSTQPTQNFILSRYTPGPRQGLVFGLHFFLNFGVGSIAAALGGYLADRFGLDSVFYAMGGCFAVASVLLLRLAIRTAVHARR